jgi:hypothetical protein
MYPTTPLTPETLEQIARKRAKAKMGWFKHATVYALVNLGLFLLSTVTGHNWHLFPLLGWGVALLIHGMVVFVLPSSDGVHARLLQKERERLQRPLP